MSDNVIEALDDVALAIRELALAQYAPIDTTDELGDIAAAIAALDVSGGGSSFDYRYALEAIASAITNRACCPTPTEPIVIYDCLTGEVKFINPEDGTVSTDPPPPGWRWPPSVPGGSGTAPEDRPPTGGVTIYEPDIDPPPTFTESDPPYGEPPPGNNTFDDTPTPRDIDAERCRKANVFVYMAWEMLSGMTSLLGAVDFAASTAFGILNPWGNCGFYFTSKTLGIIEKFVSGKMIWSFISFIQGVGSQFGWLDLTLYFDNAREDLVCAVYNATSQKDLKERWDAAVNTHYDWFSPTGVLLKLFMNKKWTGVLVDNDAVAKVDAVGYNIVCGTVCEPTSNTLTALPVRRCNSNGTSTSYYVIEWPAEFGYTDSSHAGSGYKMAWHNPDPGTCPTPYNSGANYRGTLNLSDLNNNTLYKKYRILNCTSQIVREWYNGTWGWQADFIAVADGNPSIWYDFNVGAMCLQSLAAFQIEISEEPL